MVRTPVGAIEEGKIVKPDQLIEQLKLLKQNIRWHKNKVNLCLGSQAFFMRRVQLPPMTEAEIQKALRWEVEKHFPLTAKEAVFDYCQVDSCRDIKLSAREYLLAAVPKETANAYTAALESAGFKTVSLEIQPLSLLRSLVNRKTAGREHKSKQGTACCVLLEAGFRDSTLLIVRDEEYQLYRSLKIGIDHFCQAALNTNSTDYLKAHRQVYAKGTLDERGLTKTADQLASKILQSLTYWEEQSSLSEPEVQSLEICGGGAFIPGLASHLGQKLSIRPRLYNPLSSFTGTKLSEHPEQYREEALYTAAHGLALRGWIK